MLSAAAIGLSPTMSMIPRIVEDITRVAFRFGLVVDQVCRSIEVTPDEINAEGAWVCFAYGVDKESATQEVHRFNVQNVSLFQPSYKLGRSKVVLTSNLGLSRAQPGFCIQCRW